MHVLIATDGSAHSLAAAERASELLRPADHVTLINVVTEVPGDDAGGFEGSVFSPGEQDAMWDREMAEAGRELEETAARLTSTNVDKRIEIGDVSGTVCRVAAELGVDVLVIGSHGRGAIERLLLGSASSQIVRHAPCPVLVVRSQDESE